MSPYNFFTLILVFLVSVWLCLIRKRNPKLPPGPRGLPIIGCLHLLGKLPHLDLHNLSMKYGPIMSMKLGSVTTIVVSSPQAAETFLKTHDLVISGRPKLQFSKYLSYGEKGLVFTQYGPYWRSVRKFCALELLSAKKMDSFAGMRREELVLMVNKIKEATVGLEVVNISEMVGDLTETMTCRMVFGRSHDDRFDLKGLIKDIAVGSGALNIADYAPFLGPLDLQGVTRCIKATRTVVDKVFDIIIREQEEVSNSRQKKHDTNFLDVLLSLKDKSTETQDELTRTISQEHIKAIMVDIIAAGIETSNAAIEWIMTELIRNPRIMKKLQDEIKTSFIGVSEIVEEKYLTKFNYLDLVIKENFRLHPVTPLIPRESIDDVVVNGYNIPKGSRVIFNYWALGRDPNTWSEDIEKFIPERFIGKNIDMKGQDYMLIPFGSGRRMCPGMQLGLINVRQIVAQLVHSFDWELPDGMLVNDLNMEEKLGITMPRKHGLCAIPRFRL